MTEEKAKDWLQWIPGLLGLWIGYTLWHEGWLPAVSAGLLIGILAYIFILPFAAKVLCALWYPKRLRRKILQWWERE